MAHMAYKKPYTVTVKSSRRRRSQSYKTTVVTVGSISCILEEEGGGFPGDQAVFNCSFSNRFERGGVVSKFSQNNNVTLFKGKSVLIILIDILAFFL
jgi:hypothetical protein